MMEVANVIIPEMTLRMYLIQKEIIRYMECGKQQPIHRFGFGYVKQMLQATKKSKKCFICRERLIVRSDRLCLTFMKWIHWRKYFMDLRWLIVMLLIQQSDGMVPQR